MFTCFHPIQKRAEESAGGSSVKVTDLINVGDQRRSLDEFSLEGMVL
jgi:hypothetical protein